MKYYFEISSGNKCNYISIIFVRTEREIEYYSVCVRERESLFVSVQEKERERRRESVRDRERCKVKILVTSVG